MADRGTGFVLPVPTPPIGTDYQYNWVNLNYGSAIVAEATGIKGGPAWYIDFAGDTEPEPPTSAIKVWDGTAWTSGAKTWDGTSWQPLKVWDGSKWVT